MESPRSTIQRPSQGLRYGGQLWHSLPTEVVCMIAHHFLDLQNTGYQERCSEYPRVAQLDMRFAHIDRKARSAFTSALGMRQVVIEVNYHRTIYEKSSAIDLLEREMARYLPTSNFERLCSAHNFSILRVDLGSELPGKMAKYTYKSILPATEQNISMLASFVLNNTKLIKAIGLQPGPIMKDHKPIMAGAVDKISNLIRHMKRTAVVNLINSPAAFDINELNQLRQTLNKTTNTLPTLNSLNTFYLSHQNTISDLITNQKKPLRSLLPLITTFFSAWEQTAKLQAYNWRNVSAGISLNQTLTNLSSLLLRSLTDFLLSRPNKLNHSKHTLLTTGRNKATPKNRFSSLQTYSTVRNPQFDLLQRCMAFGNAAYFATRHDLEHYATMAQQPSADWFGAVLAIIQDIAIFELALARYKTIPTVLDKYRRLTCDCRDPEQCAYMFATPQEHVQRARAKAALVKKCRDIMKRPRVSEDWVERWIGAFDSVADRIELALEGWKEGDDGILRDPTNEFDDIEFAFQFVPEETDEPDDE